MVCVIKKQKANTVCTVGGMPRLRDVQRISSVKTSKLPQALLVLAP